MSGLGAGLAKRELNGDLLGFKINKISKNMLFLPFLTTSNTWLVQSTAETQIDIRAGPGSLVGCASASHADGLWFDLRVRQHSFVETGT